jgi:hypothetical protein
MPKDENKPRSFKKGDHVIIVVSKRMVERYPALAPYLGRREWFEVTAFGKELGIRAKWDLFGMIELKILESEIAD